MKRTIFCMVAVCIMAAAFVACGKGEDDLAAIQTSGSEEPSVPEVTPEPTATAEPATEEELRKAVGTLGNEGDELSLKVKYYERLYAMDLFAEEDFLALAQAYGEQGDWERQRLMLSKVLRLYPCQEYADLVSGVVVRKDNMDEAAASLAAQMREALERQDVTALRALTETQEWRMEMLGELAGIMNRIQYRAGSDVIQIATDGLSTEIVWRDGSDHLYCYKNGAAETMAGTALLGDAGYEGPVEVSFYDGEGNILQSYQGTMSSGLCVGQITVTYQGTEYTGLFDESGRTLEEQVKNVTEKGGVCYAYAPGKKLYLYQQDATVEDFRIDAAYLGLPEYEEWR